MAARAPATRRPLPSCLRNSGAWRGLEDQAREASAAGRRPSHTTRRQRTSPKGRIVAPSFESSIRLAFCKTSLNAIEKTSCGAISAPARAPMLALKGTGEMVAMRESSGVRRSRPRTGRLEPRRPTWRIAAAGFCATLVGLGLARFAYAPMAPALIAARWFSAADVVYLGAANLAGYLAGALFARAMARKIGAVWALRAMMALATLSFLSCSAPISFLWYFFWRLLSGAAGGVIMVLAASTVLAHVSPARRGLIGGVIFAGIGFGIAASGTLAPLLLRYGLQTSWYGLGALSAVLTAMSWTNWPSEGATPDNVAVALNSPHIGRAPRSVWALWLEYGLNACALVPHMVFLVDFVARGLGQGIGAGSQYWVLYGLGALVGPLLTGHLADRSGFAPALRVTFPLEALAVLLPAISSSPVSLIPSSIVVGGFTPGIVPLVLGRIHELLPHNVEQQRAAWSRATICFALFQASAAYGFSWLFAHGNDNYSVIFALGGAALVIALTIDLMSALFVAKHSRNVKRRRSRT